MNPHEREQLIDQITDAVFSQFQTQSAPNPAAQRWLTDPLNDTVFRCDRCQPTQLLEAAPDRVGTLPFFTEQNATAPASVSEMVAGIIDHTLLKPDATPRDIEKLCHEAVRYHFKSVCVNPSFVRLAQQVVGTSGVKVCAVVGFPLGTTLTDVKAYETRRAIEEGATEIDMVIAVGMLKAGMHNYVAHDILEVVRSAGPGIIVKVILETCLLTDEEKVIGCRLAKEAGAHFVKTSTGFSSGGATDEDVRLMRETVGSGVGVKASGGVRDLDDAMKMIESGANRLGCSASVEIVQGGQSSGGY
ncbi:MAG: deoxyribose-phosphate aldolase [Planctomycetota bacterium]